MPRRCCLLCLMCTVSPFRSDAHTCIRHMRLTSQPGIMRVNPRSAPFRVQSAVEPELTFRHRIKSAPVPCFPEVDETHPQSSRSALYYSMYVVVQ
ncbi:hypothetical protein C8Q77DRAFT_1135225 [Trametes polyzona]|nr:hypothetical protein C8Q77DRAFT_1135225 [Trametes polyzona]